MARHAGTDNDLLAMALVGYEAEIGKINAAIAGIRARLGEQPVGSDGQTGPKKHRMSVAARRRIATAQRKRWAAVKKSQAQTKGAAKHAPKKRKMSAAARKRIGDATRKRWAAQRRAAGQKPAAASAQSSGGRAATPLNRLRMTVKSRRVRSHAPVLH